MWKNFGTSIGLLTIAMMAALYSSGAGRDGRVFAAAISAFVALGIAVWVAFRFVPRLAAGVDWQWLPFLDVLRSGCPPSGTYLGHWTGDACQARPVHVRESECIVQVSFRIFREGSRLPGRRRVCLLSRNHSAGTDEPFGDGHSGIESTMRSRIRPRPLHDPRLSSFRQRAPRALESLGKDNELDNS